MPIDPATIDVARDVAFLPDVKGPALLVKWRRIPVGFIQPLNRLPALPARVTGECKAQVLAQYKEHIGKWYSALLVGGYFETKEDAARYIIAKAIEASAAMPLMQAAIREDYAEVERMLRDMRAQVTVE